jgi:integrase
VDTKKIIESPTATIRKIKRERLPSFDKPPVTLTLLQTAKLLQATLQLEPGLIPYVAAGLFGGLRPDKEAARLLANDVQKDNTIHVRGSHAKDRQQRYVNMEHRLKTNGDELRVSTLKEWMELGGDFGRSVTDHKGKSVIEKPINFRRRWEQVRAAAGLIKQVKEKGKKRKQIVFTGWDQDCLRHTFASNFLPLYGVEETMKQLGHGDYGMLFAHYRALVTESDARNYWTLTPEFIKAGKFGSLRSKRRPAGAH